MVLLKIYIALQKEKLWLYMEYVEGIFETCIYTKKETLPDAMVNRRFINLSNLGDKQ